jgi:membrane protease YdiL (CAAX protease family)
VLLLAFVSATCEELFWRGWTQPELLASNAGAVTAALIASWLAYVVANALSRSLVIVAGAVVGGAVWVLLGAATGGVAAPLACHVVWTLAMLVLPPRIRGSMMSA